MAASSLDMRARLIDLDGTLVDTFPHYAFALATSTANAAAMLSALRDGHSVIALMREHGVSQSAFRRSLPRGGVRPVDGWRETIAELRRRGHPIGVVTSLPKWLASIVLDVTDLAVDLDTSVFNARKPSPTGILRALANLHLLPSARDVYVGDTEPDAVAAAASGISFVWASWGYGPRHLPAIARPQDLLDL